MKALLVLCFVFGTSSAYPRPQEDACKTYMISHIFLLKKPLYLQRPSDLGEKGLSSTVYFPLADGQTCEDVLSAANDGDLEPIFGIPTEELCQVGGIAVPTLRGRDA